MKPLLGDENVDALRQSCFFANSFPMAATTRYSVPSCSVMGFWFAAPAASAIACRTLSSAGTAR
jgi:hypothetical protein